MSVAPMEQLVVVAVKPATEPLTNDWPSASTSAAGFADDQLDEHTTEDAGADTVLLPVAEEVPANNPTNNATLEEWLLLTRCQWHNRVVLLRCW